MPNYCIQEWSRYVDKSQPLVKMILAKVNNPDYSNLKDSHMDRISDPYVPKGISLLSQQHPPIL